MIPKSFSWHFLAGDTAGFEFNEKQLAAITVAGRHICVARVGERLFACAGICPHAGAALTGGYVNAQLQLVCCKHFYKFSLQTGENVTGQGYPLKIYPLECRADGWYIGLY